MGLDNYWVKPKATPENLKKYNAQNEAMSNPLRELKEFQFDFITEAVEYEGEKTFELFSGICSNGITSFRGKVYSQLCDALLLDAGDAVFHQNWLYYNHFSDEIKTAYSLMAKHQRLLVSEGLVYLDRLKQDFKALVEVDKRKYPLVGYTLEDFTLEEILCFIEMFAYYSQLQDICLLAWY